MTRIEETERAAMQVGGVHPDWDALECFRVGYKEGAKWADKTMIEKACDWIQCMALDYMQGDITDVKWASMFADLRNYIENGDN